MSIKSVDMQTLIQKTTEVGRTQKVQDDQPHTAQQQFAVRLQQEAEARSRQITARKEVDRPSVQPDGKGAAGRDQSGRQAGAQGSPLRDSEQDAGGAAGEGSLARDPGKGRLLDIKL